MQCLGRLCFHQNFLWFRLSFLFTTRTKILIKWTRFTRTTGFRMEHTKLNWQRQKTGTKVFWSAPKFNATWIPYPSSFPILKGEETWWWFLRKHFTTLGITILIKTSLLTITTTSLICLFSKAVFKTNRNKYKKKKSCNRSETKKYNSS